MDDDETPQPKVLDFVFKSSGGGVIPSDSFDDGFGTLLLDKGDVLSVTRFVRLLGCRLLTRPFGCVPHDFLLSREVQVA